MRLKVERVQMLLAETDLSMAEIARRSGFHYVEYLSAAFKRMVGLAPSQYRRKSQGRELAEEKSDQGGRRSRNRV